MIMPNLEPIENWLYGVRQNPPPPDLIEDILFDTNEISAIVGRSEIGKTNFCNQLAHCLATETPILGRKIAKIITHGLCIFNYCYILVHH